MHGDCSIRVGSPRFTADEISACAAAKGLLSVEMDLAVAGPCGCIACRSTPQAGGNALSVAEILSLLDQARQLGARRCILVDSEPVSHPDLFQLIDEIQKRGMQIELFVGDSAVTPSSAEFFHQRHVALVLKNHAPQKSGLTALREAGYGRSSDLELAMAIEISAENLHEIPAIWRWARSENIEPRVQIITPRQEAGGRATIVPADRAKKLFEELGDIDSREFQRPWSIPPSLMGRSCNRHLYACHVTPCGAIFACVGVTIPLGNIRVSPLRDILHISEVLENLRVFGQNIKEPCRTCCKSTDCYGCRGAAYQLTGDYLAGDQLCWKADGVVMESLPFAVDTLIPHGPSIRVVDRLVRVGEGVVQTGFLVRQPSPLVDSSGEVDELAFIEMIAQSFAACHGFPMTEGQRLVSRGLLLGVRDMVVSGRARVGDQLIVTIHKNTRFGDFGVIDGEIHHRDGRPVAAAQIKIWRANSDFFQDAVP